MQIDRVITLNWGQLPNRDFDLGTITLLEGDSGSGKTTLEDAIQSVITATYKNLFQFNVGQEEVAQQSRSEKVPRNLASYILGGESTRFLRKDGATGYVGLVFRESPSEGEKTFTAILGAQASLREGRTDASGQRQRIPELEEYRLMIIDGEALSIDDFTLEVDGVRTIVLLPEIGGHLKKRYAKNFYDFKKEKRSYLTQLFGMMKGRMQASPDEAFRAARTFVRAMAYKPIKSISDFVKEQILERYDESDSIALLGRQIESMRRLREDAEAVQKNVQRLSAIADHGDNVRRHWVSGVETHYLKALYEETEIRRTLKLTRDRRRKFNDDLTQQVDRKDAIERTVEGIQQELTQLMGHLQKFEAYQHKRLYAQTKAQNEKEFADKFIELRSRVQTVSATLSAISQLADTPQYLQQNETFSACFRDLHSLSETLSQYAPDAIEAQLLTMVKLPLDDGAVIDELTSLKGMTDGIDAALALIDETLFDDAVGLLAQTTALYHELKMQEATQRRSVSDKTSEIEALSTRRVVRYPQNVENAMKAIRENLPEAKGRVLCDVVEVNDPNWQSAIEGYLAFNRFTILVDPNFEVRAKKLMKPYKAKVAQAQKAMRDTQSVVIPQDSITVHLDTDDPVARAYIDANYARVVKVPTSEALRNTARGVTQDGFGSGGYSMYACGLPDDQLTMGESGRIRRLDALRQHLLKLETVLRETEQRRDDAHAMVRKLGLVRIEECETQIAQMLQSATQANEMRILMASIDTSDCEDLERKAQSLESEQQSLATEKEGLLVNIGALRKELEHADRQLANLDDDLDQHLDKVDSSRAELGKVAEISDEYNVVDVAGRLRKEAESPAMSQAHTDERIHSAFKAMNQSLSKFRSALAEYNFQNGEAEQIVLQPIVESNPVDSWASFYAFAECYQQVKAALVRQENNVLAKHQQDLLGVELTVSQTLTHYFCNVVSYHISMGKTQIDQLNKQLKNHVFTEEVYRFTATWRADMRDYYALYERLGELPERTNIFEDGALETHHRQTLDELFELLLHSDDVVRSRKLAELTDYRNYKVYDVERRHVDGHIDNLSSFGTGSGGQLETPAYVLRTSAISSAYRLQEKSNNHFRVIVLDEAFKHMDARRSIEVMKMLADTMRFQIIFALPTVRAGAYYPHINAKYTFTKIETAHGRGELSTKVLVEGSWLANDRTRELWTARARLVEEQAALAFEEHHPDDEIVANA